MMILHTASGCELMTVALCILTQYDKDFKFEDTIYTIPLGYEELGKYGIKCIETGTFDADHLAVENKHYLFGQSFEKGVWYTEEKIKVGSWFTFDPNTIRISKKLKVGPNMPNQYDGFG